MTDTNKNAGSNCEAGRDAVKNAVPVGGHTGDPAKIIRVLLVDDSILTRERAAVFLTALEGVEVVGRAADVPTGMAMIEGLRPDVLVLDIDLPGRSGIEMLEFIRHDTNAPPVIIMLSSYDHPKLRERCAELGANFYFNKLTEFEQIAGVCQQLAQQARFRKGRNP